MISQSDAKLSSVYHIGNYSWFELFYRYMTENKPNLLKHVVIVGAIVLAVAVYFFFFNPFPSSEVIARVGTEEITQHDIDVRIRQATVLGSEVGFTVPGDAMFDRALDGLINESLIYQDAILQGYSANSELVDVRYEYAREAFDTEKAFLDRMKENLLTPKEFRENIARQIVLFEYLEEMRRLEEQERIEATMPAPVEGEVGLEVEVERRQLTQDEINLLVDQRSEELKDEFGVEVFLD